MSISHYLKEIGRGKEGCRPLSRTQAADLLGQILDQQVTDLEVGAFCLAMRVKGETPTEMCGFLDAIATRTQWVHTHGQPAVVLPSYNGARKLPVLTPLLALLLAQAGLPVLIHGSKTEKQRISTPEVLAALGMDTSAQADGLIVQPGQVRYVPTEVLCPGLQRLLVVRETIGLRNSGHSLVKLMNPCDGEALVVGSYTHPEYRLSMSATFSLYGQTAMLLRGTEGEPVADPRRAPQIDVFVAGKQHTLQEMQTGTLTELPPLPALDAHSTALWTRAVLAGKQPVPAPIAHQVQHILHTLHP